MQNMLIVSRKTGDNTLWTPWGPQKSAPRNPKLASLRKTLRKLGKDRDAARKQPLDEAYAHLPECSYDP